MRSRSLSPDPCFSGLLMSRQPFLPAFKDKFYGIGVDSGAERPEMMSLIGQCIAAWSHVELTMALVLAALLKTNTDAAMAVYLVLRRHADQRSAIQNAARIVLSDGDFDVLMAILALHKQADGERNDLAHGIFGVMDEVPDALLWTNISDHSHFLTEVYAGKAPSGDSHKRLRQTMFVYKKADIERILNNIKSVRRMLFEFECYIRTPMHAGTAEQYRQLCASPRIQQELALIARRTTR